mgnify:CR=1 FL=1
MVDKKISFYGIGALGSSLAKALYDQQIEVTSLFNRSVQPVRSISGELDNCSFATEITANSAVGDILFLTVSDDVIASLARQLANVAINWSDKVVVHCSGVLTSSALGPLKTQGASVASFHPLQTFSGKKPDAFNDIYFSLEGDEAAKPDLYEIAKLLSARAISIEAEDKALLHAAAVMASNYLATLMQESSEIASQGSIDPSVALQMLEPLVKETTANIFKKGPAEALSGPIARGDCETILHHLRLLENSGKDAKLYKQLGLATCNLAEKKSGVNPNQLKKVRGLFT